MAVVTRRRFVHQTALSAAALYGRPLKLLGEARQPFGEREGLRSFAEQTVAPHGSPGFGSSRHLEACRSGGELFSHNHRQSNHRRRRGRKSHPGRCRECQWKTTTECGFYYVISRYRENYAATTDNPLLSAINVI
jgi:hypothetical protein